MMMPDLRQAHDLRRIGVEHTVVVRLAILGEGLMDLRIGLEAGRLQSSLDHPQSAIWEDRALERLIGLQSDDDFVVAVDIAGLWASMVEGVFASTARTPFFRSSWK